MDRSTFVALAAVLGCAAGCNGEDGPPPFDGVVTIRDENNYTYTGHVDLGSIEVQAGAASTIDWSAITQDLRGRPMDAAQDVDEVYLTRFANDLTEEDVEALIASGTLEQRHIFGAPVIYENTEARTQCSFTDLEFIGGIDFRPDQDFLDENAAWAVSLFTDREPSARVSTFVAPRAASSNLLIELTDDSGSLDFQAELGEMEAIEVGDADSYLIDWSAVTRNGLGDELDPDRAEELLLGRFDDLTVEDLETQILAIETLASVQYRVEVRGQTSVDPTTATTDAGEAFAGYGSDALWVVALRCSGSTCTNPAPQILTILQAR